MGDLRQTVSTLFSRLMAWEREGFQALIPVHVLRWIERWSARDLLLSASDGAVDWALIGGRGTIFAAGKAGPGSTPLKHILKTCGLSPKDARVGLLLPEPLCFPRSFEAPLLPEDRLKELTAQELQRRTPFSPETIYMAFECYMAFACAPGAPAGGVATVHELIVRRDLAEAAAEQCRYWPRSTPVR